MCKFDKNIYRMLRNILLAGCDVSRCFRCPFGENDHEEFAEEEQKKSVCESLYRLASRVLTRTSVTLFCESYTDSYGLEP